MGNVMDSSVALIPAAQVPLPGTTKIPAGEPRQPRQGLSSLPAAAQAVISATLGQNDARYQVRPKAGAQSRRADVPRASCPCSGMAKMAMAQSVGTLSAQNPAQGLQADFTPQGMEIHSGQTHWRLALARYGYGERLEKAEGAVPQSQGNRVEYRRGPLVEWYVNGPAGLEQGFTLATRPAIASSGTPDTGHRTSDSSPLTIALEIGGDLTATAESSAEAMGGARAQGLTLRDSHGQAVLRYTGLTAHDASGRALAAWLEVDRQELRLRVDDAVARYPVVVDPYIQQAKLTASDGVANAGFGFSLSVSNDGCEIVVGVESSEAAYVFVKPAGGWTNMTQVAEMTASDGTSSSRFGQSVGMSGDGTTIAVGSPGLSERSGGAVYVFVKPSGGWATTSTFTAKLTDQDTNVLNLGLTSVSISGDGSTIVAGAPLNESLVASGTADVFVKPGGGWTTTSTVTAALAVSDDLDLGRLDLGWSVAVSGDGSTVVAGAMLLASTVNGQALALTGGAYVYVKPSGGWATTDNFTAQLTNWEAQSGDVLGTSVAINNDGSIILAGAPSFPNQDNDFSPNQGRVSVFSKPQDGWATTDVPSLELSAPDGVMGDQFGSSVGICSDSSTMVVGASVAPIGSNLAQGAVYIFGRSASGWGYAATKVIASDGASFDYLGYSVAISGDGSSIVAGAPRFTFLEPPSRSNTGAGAAYVYSGIPSASTSPTSLSFGSLAAGTTSIPQTVSLSNNGNAPLQVTGVVASSGYSTTTQCVTASPLAVGATCVESVTFDPASAGALSGTLTFTDDSGGELGSTQLVNVNGTGVPATTTSSINVVAPNPSTTGQAVTVGFVVAPQADETLTPSGTVTVNATTGESCTGSAPSGSCELTFLMAGTRTITAGYGGDTNFVGSISPGVAQSVSKIAPKVTFTGAPGSEAYQGTFTVASTTNSSSAPQYTASGSCTNLGALYTMASATGTCTSKVTWAADANYTGATRSQTTTASDYAPTVTFTGAPASAAYQGTFTVASTTNSSSPPVYTASGSCSNGGTTTYTMTSPKGVCTSTVTWAANASYAGATRSQTTTATQGGQTISFTPPAPLSPVNYNGTFPVGAQSTSGLTVVLSRDAASAGVCSLGPRTTVSGVTSAPVTMLKGAGTCTLDANQAGNSNYTAAAQQQTSATAEKVGQTISFPTAAPSSASDQSTFPVAAQSTSGLTVALSVDAGSTGVCKLGTRATVGGVTSTTVTMLKGTGICTLDANQAGNADYTPAPPVSTAAAAQPAGQTISFTELAPSAAGYQSTFPVAAESTSRLTVGLSVDAGSRGVCSLGTRTSVSGVISATVTMLSGTGTCTIDANQPGNANYTAAAQVSTSALAY